MVIVSESQEESVGVELELTGIRSWRIISLMFKNIGVMEADITI